MAEDLFAQNEQEYSRVVSSVQRRLRNAVAFTGDAKRLEFETIDKELQAADRFLEKMESEARRALSMRSRLENRLANYRSEQQSLKQEFSRARHIGSATGKGYGTPNGWDSPDASVIEVEQRQRLLDVNATIDDQTRRLGATSSVSYQNEQIGAEILGDLHENRETLVRVHDKLDDISDNMSIGSKFLRQMTFRLYQNIVILIIIILVELALMGLIIYLKVK